MAVMVVVQRDCASKRRLIRLPRITADEVLRDGDKVQVRHLERRARRREGIHIRTRRESILWRAKTRTAQQAKDDQMIWHDTYAISGTTAANYVKLHGRNDFEAINNKFGLKCAAGD